MDPMGHGKPSPEFHQEDLSMDFGTQRLCTFNNSNRSRGDRSEDPKQGGQGVLACNKFWQRLWWTRKTIQGHCGSQSSSSTRASMKSIVKEINSLDPDVDMGKFRGQASDCSCECAAWQQSWVPQFSSCPLMAFDLGLIAFDFGAWFGTLIFLCFYV